MGYVIAACSCTCIWWSGILLKVSEPSRRVNGMFLIGNGRKELAVEFWNVDLTVIQNEIQSFPKLLDV